MTDERSPLVYLRWSERKLLGRAYDTGDTAVSDVLLRLARERADRKPLPSGEVESDEDWARHLFVGRAMFATGVVVAGLLAFFLSAPVAVAVGLAIFVLNIIGVVIDLWRKMTPTDRLSS